MSDSENCSPAENPTDSSSTSDNNLAPGDILDGRYKIKELIKSGGNSAVYTAMHQLMHRLVTITVLPGAGVDVTQELERLKRESRNVSLLDHPNVVSVHDFGVAPDGSPYMVTDHLEGQSLAEVLKQEKKLSAETTARISMQILKGLSHAHHNGVVHRSLKPESIWISTDDSDHELVRIRDFGLSKVVPAAGAESQSQTQSGDLNVNPAYASPEQCLGRPVDARSDLYSTGCLMFEMLTGHPPFSAAGETDVAVDHIGRKPVLPDKCAPSALCIIVLKALEKDPGKRFQSADEMLQSLTVTGLAEAGKKGERHLRVQDLTRWIGGALVVLIVIASPYFWFFHTNSGASQLAHLMTALPAEDSVIELSWSLADRFRKEKRFAAAGTIYFHLSELNLPPLRKADALLGLYECDKGKPDLEAAKREEKQLTELLFKLDKDGCDRKDYEYVKEVTQRELRLRMLSDGLGSEAVTITYHHLADCERGLGRWQDQKFWLLKAFENAAHGKLGKDMTNTLERITLLLARLNSQHKEGEAEAFRQELIKIADDAKLPISIRAAIYAEQAKYMIAKGQLEALEDVYRREMSIEEQLSGKDSVPVVAFHIMIGDLLKSRKKWNDAIEQFKASLEKGRKIEGKYGSSVAYSLGMLVNCYQNLSKMDEAILASQELLEVQEHRFPPDHKEVINTLDMLGCLCLSANRPRDAEIYWQKYYYIVEARKPARKEEVARALFFLTQVYAGEGELEKEEKAVRKLVSLCSSGCAPPADSHPPDALRILANSYIVQHQYDRALDCEKQRLALIQSGPDRGGTREIEAICDMAFCYGALKNLPEANKLYMQALAIKDRLKGVDDCDSFSLVWTVASTLQTNNKSELALKYWQRTLQLYEKCHRKDSAELVGILRETACILDKQARYAEAAQFWLRQAEVYQNQTPPELNAVVHVVMCAVADYKILRQPSKAEASLRKLLSVLESSKGKSDPILVTPLNALGQLYQEYGKDKEAASILARAKKLSGRP